MVLSRRFVLKMNYKDKYVWLYDDNSSILSSISDTAFFYGKYLVLFCSYGTVRWLQMLFIVYFATGNFDMKILLSKVEAVFLVSL